MNSFRSSGSTHRHTALDVLPHFEPHCYQMDGICKVLDGIDLVAITPTGSGKTGHLFLTILVMIAIAKTPSLCPTVKFPKDPAIVAVCPTSSIEQQMDENMTKLGVAALTINSETVAAARLRGEDIWARAQAGISILILGPEQLVSKSFRDLLAHEPFYARVCALGVDEIHLLVIWGVNRGEFYLLQRSNARHDIQILFRQLHLGIDGRKFPELAWVLDNTDKTIILVPRFRSSSALNAILTPSSPTTVILATLADIVNEPRCQVIIATNGLAQGNDIKVIKTVIQMGEPDSIEMYVQKPGRARPTVKDPRAIFYVSANRMKLAAKIVGQTDAKNEIDSQKAAVTSAKKIGNFATPRMIHPACAPLAKHPHLIHAHCSAIAPKKAPSDIPQNQRLTKVMKAVGTERLEDFRFSIWLQASDASMGLTPLADFLPDIVIKQILDRFAKIKVFEDLVLLVEHLLGMAGYHSRLFEVVLELRETFREIRRAGKK
ncbi:P-loop containing nucleoside triphosphate hydrolase protein [Mycena rosella]|uniref:DNA 3'-5' helicase n=1 Tax=Mycena rosella TaxID=1033263 RepID=A0AAD7D9A2_MYCRO|nr:P-loop containing nucleoside triphosphate hydrolase protein [Mycena rosella]